MVMVLIALTAHMHTVIPENAFLRKGRPTTIQYLYCHPFEHELQHTPKPEKLFVIAPDGKETDVLPDLKKGEEGFRLTFTPAARGDHYLVLRAPREPSEDPRYGACCPSAKLVLHVQSQGGWEKPLAQGLDILPLTRPYGLHPGAAFRGQVLWDGKPVSRKPGEGIAIEVEKYNPAPPKDLPDDAFVTGVVTTDTNGIFVTSFPTAGWWSMTATVEAVERPNGKDAVGVAVQHTLTFWVPVGDI